MKPLCIVLFFIASAKASTFVGNGGNAGDIELNVALHHTEEALAQISALKNSQLCQCAESFENHAVCESLKRLNPEQKNFCAAQIREVTPALLERLKGEIQVEWTDDSMQVKDASGLHSADAVTRDQKMVVNRDRFVQMQPYERVFLLTHELLHTISYADDGSVGPFTGASGGKALINSMAAATVMMGVRGYVFEKYSDSLSRPQGSRKIWVDLDVQSTEGGNKDNTTFAIKKTAQTQLSGRYYLWGPLGVMLSFRSGSGKKTVYGSVEASEKQTMLGVGATYRWFLFSDPLSFWGQTHLVANALIESVSSEYEVKDAYVGTKDEVSSTGVRLEVNYYLPIAYGIWGFVGAGYQTHQYSYSKINLNYDQNQMSGSIGVSYGF